MTPTTASLLLQLEATIVGSIATLTDADRLASRITGLPLAVRERLVLASLHAQRALQKIAPAVLEAVRVQDHESPFVGEIT